MIKLNPCRVCGCEEMERTAYPDELTGLTGRYTEIIECARCGNSVTLMTMSIEQTCEAWNAANPKEEETHAE